MAPYCGPHPCFFSGSLGEVVESVNYAPLLPSGAVARYRTRCGSNSGRFRHNHRYCLAVLIWRRGHGQSGAQR